MSYKTKRVALLGLLIALEIVLSRFLSIATPYLKIGFAFVPVMTAALLYGPLWAGASAALADIIGAVLFPIGAYFPGFTFTAFLTGAVFGLFLYNRRYRVRDILFAALIVSLGLNLCLDTLWLRIIMGEAVAAQIPARLLKCVVMVPVQTLVGGLALRLARGVREGVARDEKNALRARARTFFKDDGEKRDRISAAVARRALGLGDYTAASTIFCFVGTARELDTSPIINAALRDGKTVCVPLTGENGGMTARKINSLSELRPGRYGIDEPDEASEIIDVNDIDLVFAPCSACDVKRGRIGKGGGYYDRFLSGARAKKIALCPDALVVKRVPIGELDVAMDMVLTESREI